MDFEGTADNPETHILCWEEKIMFLRYATITANKQGDAVNIMFVTDMHLNRINEEDRKNPTVVDTHLRRDWCRDEESLPAAQNLIPFYNLFDAVAITGDNMDYLTYGGIELLKENIFDVIKKPYLVTLGGHDLTRVMLGKIPDEDTASIRPILQSVWPHDIDYHSIVIKDRIMMIGLNNGAGCYLEGHKEKLAADIEKARKENLTILIFQHEPLATLNPEEPEVFGVHPRERDKSIKNDYGIGSDFYYNKAPASKEVYKIITENADVIKGVFCGHEHIDLTNHIKASYMKNGIKTDAVIPQYLLKCNPYGGGYFFSLTVE